MPIRLRDIAVVDVHDRLIRDPTADDRQIGSQGLAGDAFVQMSGEALHRIDFFGRFVKLVHDVCEKAAVGGKHAVGHVGGKLPFRFGKLPEKLI